MSSQIRFWKPNPHIHAVEQSLRLVGLSDPQKTLLLNRFMTVLRDYHKRKIRYSVSFHVLRTMITIGSLIVPAILSVQYTSGNVSVSSANLSSEVYWIVWVLSLFVTISNGIMTLMKIDKKYFVFHTVFEQLLSEAWQYIDLTGRYSGQHTPGVQSVTHITQFAFFCHQIEKIRMKQVEDEYYKVMEHSTHTNRTTNDSIVPATPFRMGNLTQQQWLQQQADLAATNAPVASAAPVTENQASAVAEQLPPPQVNERPESETTVRRHNAT